MQKEDMQKLMSKFLAKEPKTPTEQKMANRIQAGEAQIKKATDELTEARKRTAELEYGITALGNQVKGLLDLALEMQMEEDESQEKAIPELVFKDNKIEPKDVT